MRMKSVGKVRILECCSLLKVLILNASDRELVCLKKICYIYSKTICLSRAINVV